MKRITHLIVYKSGEFFFIKEEKKMDWLRIYYRVLSWSMNHAEYLIPIQLTLLAAVLVLVILSIIKDKQSRWLASSLAVMIALLFLGMLTYSNLFNVVFRRMAIYKVSLIYVPIAETKRESSYLVWAVLLLDVAFIFCYCMYFIRKSHTGVINLIVALAASAGTRITGYLSTITPPTFAFCVFGQRHGYSELMPKTVSAPLTPFGERIVCLFTAPKIIGIILVAILFTSLITLSLRTKRFAPKRNKLFVFPSLVLVIELIRYVTISICDLFFERLTDLRFGLINIIACIICLVWAVYLFKTRTKV